MFGNRFAAEELARNFQKIVSKSQALKKEAKSKKVVSPEDFLISAEEEVDVHTGALDSKIEEVSSYAQDKDCPKCKAKHEGECPCTKCKKVHSGPCEKKAEDISYLVDKKAQYVLHQLGKIAGGLRSKKNNFAADMVEVTAAEIKNKSLKKASQKFQVVASLEKMAHESYISGDQLTGDVISVTIENIKKAK